MTSEAPQTPLIPEMTAASTTDAAVSGTALWLEKAAEALHMETRTLLIVLIIVAAALVLGAVAAVIAIICKRKQKEKEKVQEEIPVTKTEELPPEEVEIPTGPRIGKVHEIGARDEQQDCFAVSDVDLLPNNGLLAVVADGMGGLQNGMQVSSCAVTGMLEQFYLSSGSPTNVLLEMLRHANDEVNAMLRRENLRQAGSTLVAGLVRDGMFHFVSVGDSRVCLYRNGALLPLNREHVLRKNLEVRMVNNELTLAQVSADPQAAGLTSFIGMGTLAAIDLPSSGIPVQNGDMFLLMSDGVYNALTDEELISCLQDDPQASADAIRRAIQLKDYPTQDNYTAVLIAC